eukprot:s736_g7.t1
MGRKIQIRGILQEIVDETDVYVDVDRRLKIGGRDTTNFNLGVFNPIWRSRGDKLSLEEVNAISAHLMRTAFAAGNGCALQYETITWLVGEADVQNLSRNAPAGLDPCDTDWIYRRGQASSRCTLVLQGRLGAIVGHESFKTENGAQLWRRNAAGVVDALLPEPFKPDFDAFLSTPKVRILSIKKELFQRAKELDKDPEMLEQAKKTQVLAVSVTRKRWTYGGRDGPEARVGTWSGLRLAPRPHVSDLVLQTAITEEHLGRPQLSVSASGGATLLAFRYGSKSVTPPFVG